MILKNALEITQFIETVFTTFNGYINLAEIDIREGSHLVDVSRRIFQRLVEANDFENNFCSKNSRIPKTYFVTKNKALSLKDKAEIFALHYVSKSKAESKGVRQGLKRNNSFKAFGVPLPNVLETLKTRKLLDVYSVDQLNSDGRQMKKYKITYNSQDMEHSAFFEKYQALYPGEVL